MYADEVWPGIEYQVASHLIYEGLVDEGLAIVRGVRERHRGDRRNPWDEFECGHHYARSMASYGVLTALAGFSYNGVARRMGFAPRVYANRFRTFWSVGSGWGDYSQLFLARAKRRHPLRQVRQPRPLRARRRPPRPAAQGRLGHARRHGSPRPS